tara:strand:- start:2636 stop:3223 length:588 start_codon:yes stop_codon:yes gene_type:complete
MSLVGFRMEIIGSDESLKGDTFGGIVVAAVKADDAMRKRLEDMSVGDSKKIADSKVLLLAAELRKICEFHIVNLSPKEYNARVANGVTILLDELHKEVYDYLKPGQHVVDLYPGCSVGHIRETKAEDKYVEVAAASLLARADALLQFDALSNKAGFRVQRGSTHVQGSLEKLKEKGLPFSEFVKMGFKNVKKFLE